MRSRNNNYWPLVFAATALLCGCDPVSLTAFGVGASAGVSQTLNGISYRTFTAPISKVRGATVAALERMSIKIGSSAKTENGEIIKAKTPDRDIEIELEIISPNTTRMRSVAKKDGVLYDSATATEIILQTQKVLNNA